MQHSQAEAERALRAIDADADGRADALRRLHAALRESLERHADEQAAVDVAYYVVVPYLPDQSTRLDWRAAAARARAGDWRARRSSVRSRRTGASRASRCT